MIKRSELDKARHQAAGLLANTGIIFRHDEMDKIEVADFGLSELWTSGVQILTLVNTERIAAKLLVLFPYQRPSLNICTHSGEPILRYSERR